MSLFSSLLTALTPKYNASVIGENIRITRTATGNTESYINVGRGATHAIMQGDNVSVFYRNGGVKIYTKSGGFVNNTGNCT
jgi:hypothetical protein